MTSVFFILCLLIVSPAHAALYELNDGHAPPSYLLGLHAGLSNQPLRRVLEPLVSRSCALVLVSDPWLPVRSLPIPPELHWRPTDAPTRSPEAMTIMSYLLEDDDDDVRLVARMSAGAASQILRLRFGDERDRVISAYWRAFADGRTGPAVSALAPGLLDVARELYRTDVDAAILRKIVWQRYFGEESGGDSSGDLGLALRIKAGGQPLTELEPAVNPAAHVAKVTERDLERMLFAAADFLTTHDSNWFWSYLTALWLNEELRARFIRLPTARYARLQNLIWSALPTSATYLPGEEIKRRVYLNRHNAWLTPIGEAIARGGAFIAVPAAHVVPQLDPAVDLTLVDQLGDHGIRVTPVPLK